MAPVAENAQACLEKLGLARSALRAEAAEFTPFAPAPFAPTCYYDWSGASTCPPSPVGSTRSISSEASPAALACQPATAAAPGLPLLLVPDLPPVTGDASCRDPLAWPPAAPAAPPGLLTAPAGHRADAPPGHCDAALGGAPPAPPPGLDLLVEMPPGLQGPVEEQTPGRPCEPWFVSLPKETRRRQLPAGEPIKKQPPTWASAPR